MKIVTDIGATHIRFAQVINGEPVQIQKYTAADFKNLDECLAQYCKDESIADKGDLLIAAAGASLNGAWTITNNPNWPIVASGWNTPLTLNDFEAAAYSLSILNDADLKTLKTGAPSNNTLCLIGAGTGLGLAYYRNNAVQKTHGGHIPIASLNDEHGKAIKDLREHQSRPLNRAIVFEDLVSGPALQKLRDIYDDEKSSRLFHEFLGIFAAIALVTGDAYGGLYLSGGVITSLNEGDAFDTDRFAASLCFGAVPCVKSDIQNTPIHIITDPFPALKGLIHAQSLSNN